MINLIPHQAKISLTKEYWLRTVTTWFFFWAVMFLLGVFILVPAYFLLHLQVKAYSIPAASASEKIADFDAVAKELTQAGSYAAFVKEKQALTPVSTYVALLRSFETNDISITNVGVKRSEKGVEPISLSGVAKDRQALATFRDRMLADELIESVDLPISNLAKDRDITFEMKVTIRNTKGI